MTPQLTVFTPTYNRAHTIGRTYESLCRQSCKDLVWLVIDDGSEDETRTLVSSWFAVKEIESERYISGVAKGGFPMVYAYKENGGLHTGYNKAIELMNTELCVCIDSDDWMPDDAVESILTFWKKNGSNQYSGIIAKDYTPDDKPIGNDFPNLKSVHISELMSVYKSTGDRKIVMRVDLLKRVYPQPSFEGEKNFNPIYLMLKIDRFYPFLLYDKNLCFVDYQQNGMSANIVNQYFNSPHSFVELRKLYISLVHTTKLWRFRQYVHLVANSKIAKVNPFNVGVNNWVVALAWPVGMMLYLYLLKKRSV